MPVVDQWGRLGQGCNAGPFTARRELLDRMHEGGAFFVGEQMRGVAVEQAYNRRWLMGLIVGPLLVGVFAAAWMIAMADRLPDELASHWNAKNEVDGWMSLAGAAWMAVGMGAFGALIAPLAVLLRAQTPLVARIGVGFGLVFSVAAVALSVAIVAGQLDLADTSQAELSGPIMAAGIAAAFLVGCVAAWLYRPGEVERTQDPEVLDANESATASGSGVARDAQARAARGETLRIKVSMGAWTWVLSLGMAGIVGLGTFFIFPALALLGVVLAAIVWVFCHGTVVIGPDGYKVLAGGFWQIMPLQWREIRRATVQDIKAMDYGGWGYRMNAGSIGFIMGSGPAVVIEAGFHQKFVVSIPDVETAGEAAALINAYIHAAKVKN